MKHIFHVCNHLAFYVSLSVQEHLSLDPKKVYFLSSYRYNEAADPFKRSSARHSAYVPVSELPVRTYLKTFARYIPLLNYLPLKRFILSLGLITEEEDFIFYTSNISHNLYQVLGSFKGCKEVCMIEEGNFSYTPTRVSSDRYISSYYFGGFFRPLLQPYRDALGHFGRYAFNLFGTHSKTQVRVFTLHKKALTHKAYAQTIIPLYRDESVKIDIPEGATLFFTTNPLDRGDIRNKKKYGNMLKKAFTMIPAETIYLKFHHLNTEESREQIYRIIKDLDKKWVIIPDKIPVEQIFIRRKQLKVYAIISSTLLYTKILKAGEAYAFFDMFKPLYVRRSSWVKDIRGLFNELNIHFLQANSKQNEKPKD